MIKKYMILNEMPFKWLGRFGKLIQHDIVHVIYADKDSNSISLVKHKYINSDYVDINDDNIVKNSSVLSLVKPDVSDDIKRFHQDLGSYKPCDKHHTVTITPIIASLYAHHVRHNNTDYDNGSVLNVSKLKHDLIPNGENEILNGSCAFEDKVMLFKQDNRILLRKFKDTDNMFIFIDDELCDVTISDILYPFEYVDITNNESFNTLNQYNNVKKGGKTICLIGIGLAYRDLCARMLVDIGYHVMCLNVEDCLPSIPVTMFYDTDEITASVISSLIERHRDTKEYIMLFSSMGRNFDATLQRLKSSETPIAISTSNNNTCGILIRDGVFKNNIIIIFKYDIYDTDVSLSLEPINQAIAELEDILK